MMRVWCDQCGQKLKLGTRQVRARSDDGEPAEFERVTKGRAKVPVAVQRVMYVNGIAQPLPADHYDCDNCGAPIRPGDPATSWTVWMEGTAEPELWELEYLEL